ncbi:MAG: peptidylprolyl isomerase [Bryobacteraceae bacterium]
MKFLSVFVFACCSAVWAQTAPAPGPGGTAAPQMPDIPDQTTIAVFDDGVQFTMADFKKIIAVLPPDNQPLAMRDRKTFLQQWAFMRKLAQMAEKQKLDQENPAREQLEYSRLMILSQAKLAEALNSLTVEPAEIVNFYDTNKERFKEIRVKTIYVSFGNGGKARTEDEAMAKATKLLADIRGGADFVKLVKENSEDETSKAKDGDFATLRRNDNIPDAIRTAVFSLKQGEVSEPVRQPNGFYLLRADEVRYRPLSQVRDEIFTQLKQEHYGQWLEQTNKDTKVEFTNPAFLGDAAAPPATGK